MRNSLSSPFYRNPDHPCFNRRAFHHDYNSPAKYLITICKNPAVGSFCTISGDVSSLAPDCIMIDLSATGKVIPQAVEEWQRKYQIYVAAIAVMPDHVHLCIDVVAHLPNGLSRAMASLMGKISSAYHHSLPEGERPAKMVSFFAKGFNDRIAYTAEQWENQKRYVNDNPRRYLIKKRFPDFMTRRWLLTMPDGRQFVARGNVFLLRQPELFRVKTSRRFTEAEADACTDGWKRQLYNGSIPISPFIHKHEKGLRDMAANEGFSYIRVCTNGFGEREAPAGREFELMAEGRLLLIGQRDFSSRKEDLKYSFAQELNKLALELAEICNSGAALSLRPL